MFVTAVFLTREQETFEGNRITFKHFVYSGMKDWLAFLLGIIGNSLLYFSLFLSFFQLISPFFNHLPRLKEPLRFYHFDALSQIRNIKFILKKTAFNFEIRINFFSTLLNLYIINSLK